MLGAMPTANTHKLKNFSLRFVNKVYKIQLHYFDIYLAGYIIYLSSKSQ